MNYVLAGRLWRKPVVLISTLLITLSCDRETAKAPVANIAAQTSGVRVIEPRLIGFGTWSKCHASRPDGVLVPRVTCGPATPSKDPVSIPSSGCDRKMSTMAEAVQALAFVPACTDAVVEKLEQLALPGRDAAAMSNLAAAYYARAQRHDEPTDLVRALNAAEVAVELSPQMPEATFNLALTEEALGFTDDAIESWDRLRKAQNDGWNREAATHWESLVRQRTISQALQWRLNEVRIPEMVRVGDRAAIETLIRPFHGAAQRFVEEKVLPQWAAAVSRGDVTEAGDQLTIAHEVASALMDLSGDRYLLDVVERVRAASDAPARAALVRGHVAFAEARSADRLLRDEKKSAIKWEAAEQALEAAQSPLLYVALIAHAAQLTIGGDFDRALTLLKDAEAEAIRRNSPSLLGRVQSGRGFAAMMRGSLLDAIAEYTFAQTTFERAHDQGNVSNAVTRKIGIYRLIGNHQLTWREVYRTRDDVHTMSEPQSRHLLLGENALSALQLGYPRVALRYQNTAVELLRDELARNANDETQVSQLRKNLGIALRARAAIHAHLSDDKSAQQDLKEGFDRIEADMAPADAAILNGFRARLAEAQAEALEATDRRGAIAALSQGIRQASKTHFQSLKASLFAQRARLYQLENNQKAEIRDLRAALRALRTEETAMLGTPAKPSQRPTNAEQMWSAYFGRYLETYRRLIQRLVEMGNDAEAFDYAEKARAFEPLHLILKRADVPRDFRSRIRNGEPFTLEDVKQVLPASTFLLQYSVLSDRTYVWVVWTEGSERTTLPVGHDTIARWTTTLQRLAVSGDVDSFAAALEAPYAALLREPLARVAKLKTGTRAPRVVIVPDRSMHGLPFSALGDGSRHVVRDYTISVAPSATMYAFSLTKDRERAAAGKPESILIVADPAFNRGLELARGLDRLDFARDEAARIKQLYEPLLRVDSLPDEKATITEFLRLATESTIIHIAAHGIANAEIPSRSFLLFAPGTTDSGALDAERLIHELRLERARLAVVAACSSAGGTPVGPEGLAPLVRPLITAGVPGVVGTLWNVNENPATAELLVRFHRHYRKGLDADEALRQAQLEMLEDPDLGRSSVIAWAPFQFIGYSSSPFAQQTRR
jgi:CHAT domain-containing protein